MFMQVVGRCRHADTPIPPAKGQAVDRGNLEKEMAGVTGLEPATSGVTGRRSDQLSYTPARAGDIAGWLEACKPDSHALFL